MTAFPWPTIGNHKFHVDPVFVLITAKVIQYKLSFHGDMSTYSMLMKNQKKN